MKKGSIDTIWYESVYEPEKTRDRLPDFFYETMEKKDLENRLISPEVRVLKGRLTSEDDYLYITFDSFYTSYVPYCGLGKSGYEMPMYVRIKRTEEMTFADGVVLWLQIPEIRIEKNGAGLMPAGGFVYV